MLNYNWKCNEVYKGDTYTFMMTIEISMRKGTKDISTFTSFRYFFLHTEWLSLMINTMHETPFENKSYIAHITGNKEQGMKSKARSKEYIVKTK